METIQYRAAFVIAGAIKDTSRDRLYQEICLESLAERIWSRKIFFFHKFVNGLLPSYLQLNLIIVMMESTKRGQHVKTR